MTLAAACLHLAVLFVSHTSTAPAKPGADIDTVVTAAAAVAQQTDRLCLPSLLLPLPGTARVCLKAPGHGLHATLQGPWWTTCFDVDQDFFRDAVAFVVTANSNSMGS
jgi:hypothetical protein